MLGKLCFCSSLCVLQFSANEPTLTPLRPGELPRLMLFLFRECPTCLNEDFRVSSLFKLLCYFVLTCKDRVVLGSGGFTGLDYDCCVTLLYRDGGLLGAAESETRFGAVAAAATMFS